MSVRVRRTLLAIVALGVMLAAAAMMRQQETPEHHFRIVFGLKDQKPTEWSGKVAVAGGTVTALGGWRFDAKEDSIDGTSGWTCSTRNEIAPEKRYPVQGFDGKPKGEAVLSPWPNGVHVSVHGASPTLTLKLAKGVVKFSATEVPLGEPKLFLDGQVRVERLPATNVLRSAAAPKVVNPVQDDYPAFWAAPSGKQYLAWIAYQKEQDRVLLCERDGPNGKWSEPVDVDVPGKHFRVALAGTGDGTLWVVWSSYREQQWDLNGRAWKDGKSDPPIIYRLTLDAGPDFWHRMTTDSRGRVWLVWQTFRGKQSDIYARCADKKGWHPAVRVSTSENNDWDPVIAADTHHDRVWVGWDTYTGENYRVQVRSLSGGPQPKLGEVLTPEASPVFGAHVSLACDRDGRLWAAWDESGPQWGKDTGFLYGGQHRTETTRLYASRGIRVKCLVGDRWMEPAADFNAVLPADMKEYNELPQLQADRDGRVWMAFRHRTCRRPREDGWAAQGRWDLYATAFLGDRWLSPVELPGSGGRIDMRTASHTDGAGNVYFAYASDNRPWSLPAMPPRNHNLAVSRFGPAPKLGTVKMVERKRDYPIAALVHPKEKEQVARIRNYKVEAGGKTYRIYRGDLHRHTDISGDGPGDGSLMDLHRYGLDAAAMDFILVGDHNMGNDNEYCWWRTQQANDLYTVPGAFISMYGYERSVKYPYGHRNIIWTERGHRTLPLPAKPLPAAFKGDTQRLYDYLRRTDGICTLHTSASDQGTNWEDPHDPKLEPFVEIFQGYHTSYEAPGAPKVIDAKTDRIHGAFQADGFVSLALKKGCRLGFQASSDHISTHVSYACVLAEEFSRKGLVEAMRKRHTYAATDNIVLDFRLGNSLMGDEVRTLEPRFSVTILGTNLIARVEILRNGEVVHTHAPKAATDEARFTWTDPTPVRGEKASYYYVRVTQVDGQMAWASPIWVTVGK